MFQPSQKRKYGATRHEEVNYPLEYQPSVPILKAFDFTVEEEQLERNKQLKEQIDQYKESEQKWHSYLNFLVNKAEMLEKQLNQAKKDEACLQLVIEELKYENELKLRFERTLREENLKVQHLSSTSIRNTNTNEIKSQNYIYDLLH